MIAYKYNFANSQYRRVARWEEERRQEPPPAPVNEGAKAFRKLMSQEARLGAAKKRGRPQVIPFRDRQSITEEEARTLTSAQRHKLRHKYGVVVPILKQPGRKPRAA